MREAVVDFKKNPKTKFKDVDKLSEKEAKGKRPLEGKVFVFTGGLDDYTRTEAKEAVERLGARATSSVSGNTDFVVVGEEPGSKLDDAKEHNVKTIDEKEFEKLLKS